MSATKHTPGLWTLHHYSSNGVQSVDLDFGDFDFAYQAIGAGDTLIGKVEFMNGHDGGFPSVASYDEMMANAHMMAAAPEMYEWLAGIKDWFDDNGYSDLRNRVAALLKKARGEA